LAVIRSATIALRVTSFAMSGKQGVIYIGISGWRYAGWRGVFYPKRLPQRHELRYSSRQFSSIELNGSFYSLQRPGSYVAWRNETPPGFRFAVKGGRFITHLKKLRDVESATANFFASGVLALEEKLGPFLWQLPPQFVYDEAKLQRFVELLPHTSREAAKLGEQHDEKLKCPPFLEVRKNRTLHHVMEVRHSSFETKRFLELLRRYRIGNVVADTARRWPLIEDLSGGVAYVRLHGDEELYASGYSAEALQDWARRILSWSRGEQVRQSHCFAEPCRAKPHDVYVYFDNDAKVHAPFDAMSLTKILRNLGGNCAEPAGCGADEVLSKFEPPARVISA
jgi:uncharacterized protein YecE (DUF72 family)